MLAPDPLLGLVPQDPQTAFKFTKSLRNDLRNKWLGHFLGFTLFAPAKCL